MLPRADLERPIESGQGASARSLVSRRPARRRAAPALARLRAGSRARPVSDRVGSRPPAPRTHRRDRPAGSRGNLATPARHAQPPSVWRSDLDVLPLPWTFRGGPGVPRLLACRAGHATIRPRQHRCRSRVRVGNSKRMASGRGLTRATRLGIEISHQAPGRREPRAVHPRGLRHHQRGLVDGERAEADPHRRRLRHRRMRPALLRSHRSEGPPRRARVDPPSPGLRRALRDPASRRGSVQGLARRGPRGHGSAQRPHLRQPDHTRVVLQGSAASHRDDSPRLAPLHLRLFDSASHPSHPAARGRALCTRSSAARVRER